ncbi:hypothetical protein L1987_76845 [Smallanthus sonchifolius]|uniref:Uncharacterized protein n=1 Tax=Smallanthus sonchifolius TaxID=185202 RepID=A0ACB8Z855_9ASTR|nr:hypothetical protein L1987_76845 [Smallanthus sonchifolius]
MMSRMLLSSTCVVLVILLCLSQQCRGRGRYRYLSSIDDHAMDDKSKLLDHSTIKGLGNDPLPLHGDLGLKMTEKGKDQKQKDMIKDQKVKKFKEVDRRHQHQHHPKSITFRVPLKHGQIHQQPGFNLDYSPPKTHPPSHN